jgi:hypothetical protein
MTRQCEEKAWDHHCAICGKFLYLDNVDRGTVPYDDALYAQSKKAAAQPVSAPSPEIPAPTSEECFERLREIIADMSGGLEAYGDASDASRMDGTFYLSALESSLRVAREERDLCPECDRPKSLLSNGPTEYKHVCEFCEMLKENDRLDGELQSEREARKQAEEALRRIVASDDVWEMLEIARAALVPQEPRKVVTQDDIDRIDAEEGPNRAVVKGRSNRFGDSHD